MLTQLRTHLENKTWFLVLLPVFFIAKGYNDFFSFFPLRLVTLNFSIAVLFTAVVYLLSRYILKEKKKTAVFTFFFVLFILTFGFLHDHLKAIFPKQLLSSYRFLLPGIFIITVGSIFFIRKQKNAAYKKLFLYLNTVVLCLLVYEAGNGVFNYMQHKKGDSLIDPRFTAFHQLNTNNKISDSLKPDIYFLVFDAMPSTNAMKAYWKYDNSSLDSFLLRENFYTSLHSKSNYNLTVLSVSSTLNMDFLPTIDLKQDETKMYFKASASIMNNSLTKILDKEGYTMKQYQPVSFNNTDWKGALFFSDMLYMNYFYKTLPGRIYRDLGWNLSKINAGSFKDGGLSKFEKRNIYSEKFLHQTIELVKKSCQLKKEKPQFIYAHFQVPHDPYIFDSTGKLKPTKLTFQLKEEDHPAAFIQQVQFANKIIADLVKTIKTKNKKNTIIIIEGDHGFRNIYGKKGYMTFENLNTFYFPDKNYKLLYDSISPVNSFRVVLNNFFAANLPLLKDSSIFIPYTLPGENK